MFLAFHWVFLEKPRPSPAIWLLQTGEQSFILVDDPESPQFNHHHPSPNGPDLELFICLVKELWYKQTTLVSKKHGKIYCSSYK